MALREGSKMAIYGHNPLLLRTFERLMSDIISNGYAKHFVQTRASLTSTQNQVESGPEIELGPEDPPKWPFSARIYDVTDFLSISRVIL